MNEHPKQYRISIPEHWFTWKHIQENEVSHFKLILTQAAYEQIKVIDLIGLNIDQTGTPSFVFNTEKELQHFKEKYL